MVKRVCGRFEKRWDWTNKGAIVVVLKIHKKQGEVALTRPDGLAKWMNWTTMESASRVC